MALNVGTLYANLALDPNQFRTGLRTAVTQANTAGTQIGRNLGGNISQGVTTGTHTATTQINRLQQHNAQAARRMGGAMKAALIAGGAAAVAGIAIAVRGAVGLIKDGLKESSDWQQARGALKSVAGKEAAGLREWSEQQAKYGQSASEAANSAVLLITQLRNAGFAASEAASKSKELVGLGQDLAATFGGPTKDAVEAISAVMKGEFDSIEKYGVSLTADMVKAEAVTAGIVKATTDPVRIQSAQAALLRSQERLNEVQKDGKATAGELAQAKAAVATAEDNLHKAVAGSIPALTQQQSKAAALSLVLKQTKAAQGQATREQKTLAAQQERSAAAIKNFKSAVGDAFRPAVTMLVTEFNDEIERGTKWIRNHMPMVRRYLKHVAEAVIEKWPTVKKWIKQVFTYLKENKEPISDTLKAIGESIKIVAKFTHHLMNAFSDLPDGGQQAVIFLGLGAIAFGQLAGIITTVGGGLSVLTGLFGGAGAAAGGITGLITGVGAALLSVAGAITGVVVAAGAIRSIQVAGQAQSVLDEAHAVYGQDANWFEIGSTGISHFFGQGKDQQAALEQKRQWDAQRARGEEMQRQRDEARMKRETSRVIQEKWDRNARGKPPVDGRGITIEEMIVHSSDLDSFTRAARSKARRSALKGR